MSKRLTAIDSGMKRAFDELAGLGGIAQELRSLRESLDPKEENYQEKMNSIECYLALFLAGTSATRIALLADEQEGQSLTQHLQHHFDKSLDVLRKIDVREQVSEESNQDTQSHA